MRTSNDKTERTRLQVVRLAMSALLVLAAAFGGVSARGLDLDPVVVGRWPTFGARSIRSVVVEEGYAYCSTSGGLLILDVSDPAESSHDLRVVGSLDGDALWFAALSDGLAYASSTTALVIIDVSDPENPHELSRHDGVPGKTRLFVSGSYAHVVGFGGVVILDVSDPADPRFISEYPIPSGALPRDVYVVGDHAYVATSGGLTVVDVSSPMTPQPVATVPSGSTYRVIVSEGRAYVDGGVIDVRDPGRPEVIGTYLGRVHGLAGDLLVSRGWLWDMSDPASPRAAGVFDVPEAAWEILVSGTRVVISGYPGLHVVDIGGAEYDAFVSAWGSWVVNGALLGQQAYVTTEDARLQVVDVSDPARPRLTGSLELPPREGELLAGTPSDIVVAGDHAYVTSLYDGLRVVDVSDAASPRQVATALEAYGAATAVAVSGELCFVIGKTSFTVLDVSDPTDPRSLSSVDLPADSFPQHFTVSGPYAYICGLGPTPLLVIDASDPLRTRQVGGCSNCAPASVLAISGNYAYSTVHLGVEVVDLRDPVTPVSLGIVDLGSRVTGIAVSGERAIVTTDNGLRVLDLTEPSAPRPGAIYPTPAPSGTVELAGSLAFVLANSLQVVDTSLPAPDRLPRVGLYETVLSVQDVAARAGQAYILDDHANLHLFDVTDPSRPRRVGRYENSRDTRPLGARESRVFLDGDHARVIDHIANVRDSEPTVIESVDISEPSSPTAESRYDTGILASHVTAADGFAYLVHATEPGASMSVIRLADPSDIHLVGAYAVERTVSALYVHGDLAYLLLSDGEREVVDVTDPSLPRFVRRESAYSLPLVADGRAYVEYIDPSDPTIRGFEILDGVDPFTAEALGHYAGDAVPYSVAGGRAFTTTTHGHQVIDVTDPTQPRLAGRLPGIDVDVRLVAGDLVYSRGHPPSQDELSSLEISDVSPIAAFQRLGEGGRLSTAESGGTVGELALVDEFAVVADGTNGLEIFDVSDPAIPRRVGSYDTGDIAEGVVVSGGLAYVANGGSGLYIVDVSDPGAPRLVGSQDTVGYAHGVDVAGTRAYVAAWTAGLQIIDVSDPARPRRLGGLQEGFGHDVGHLATCVDFSDNHAYVGAVGLGGLYVVDVSDPASPRRVGYGLFRRDIPKLVARDHRVFLVNNDMQIVDVSEPSDPRPLGRYPVSGVQFDILGQQAYVIGAYGLQVLDVTDPADIRRVGGNSVIVTRPEGTPSGWFRSQPLDVAVANGRVLALSGSWGIIALEPTVPFAPTDVVAEPRDGEVALSWTPPEGGLPPAGYDVYRVAPEPRTRLNTEPIREPSATVAELENAVTYCFVVQSVAASGRTSIDSAHPACATPTAPPPRFLRGDCNQDTFVDISDAVFALYWLYLGGAAPPCVAAANMDGVMPINPADPIYLLAYLYLGGPAVPPPFPDCGPAFLPSELELGCDTPAEACE